jgi:hypothetical protein
MYDNVYDLAHVSDPTRLRVGRDHRDHADPEPDDP